MSKRPSFQFYPADWKTNAKLRRCSPAARGIWMDILCLLHDSDVYGLVQWPLVELARAAGAAMGLVRELVAKGVLKGCESGPCESYIYIPRSGRKDGAPVVLVPAQQGPIWFSSRMIKDEYIRANAGASSRFVAQTDTPSHSPQSSPSHRQGDGSTSSSSSSKEEKKETKKVSPSAPASDAQTVEPIIPKPVQELELEIPPALDRRPKNGDPDGFAEWYEANPRKVARPAAAKAYAKAREKADAATLLTGIKRYAASRANEDPKFTAHPATWLNGERWKDEEPTHDQAGRPPQHRGNSPGGSFFGAAVQSIRDDIADEGDRQGNQGPPRGPVALLPAPEDDPGGSGIEGEDVRFRFAGSV